VDTLNQLQATTAGGMNVGASRLTFHASHFTQHALILETKSREIIFLIFFQLKLASFFSCRYRYAPLI
jgi:hypothetical protein